jgi:ribonuclease J
MSQSNATLSLSLQPDKPMPEVQLTVHRSAHEIGGNCIEISVRGGSRILLNAGRPLDAPEGRSDLLPSTLDRARPIAGVLISDPHQDHYGLIGELPAHWPVAANVNWIHVPRLG